MCFFHTLHCYNDEQKGTGLEEKRHVERFGCCGSLFSKLRSFYTPKWEMGRMEEKLLSIGRAACLIQRNHANCHSSAPLHVYRWF
jgi:hypothetical protein